MRKQILIMNILVLGSGGREHTFAWKIAQSEECDKLFVAPGNSGTEKIATNLSINVTDFGAIKAAVLENDISLVVVGPEDPLVQGIHDFFLADETIKHISVIGPQKAAAELNCLLLDSCNLKLLINPGSVDKSGWQSLRP